MALSERIAERLAEANDQLEKIEQREMELSQLSAHVQRLSNDPSANANELM